MDNLTHALAGAALSRAVAGTAQRNPVWWAFMVGSEIPDIDFYYQLQGHTSYLLNHRGWTHSLPGLAVLSMGVALSVFFVARREGKFRTFLAVSLFACMVHVALDVLTSWGTGLFYPFQTIRVSLDVLPIIDPVIYGILFAGLLVARLVPNSKKTAKATLAVMLIFIAARGGLHFAAVNHFTETGAQGKLLAIPGFNPLKWRMVIEQPGGFELGRLDLGTGAFEVTGDFQTAGSAEVRDYTTEPETGAFLNFFRVPVFSVTEREGKKFILMKDLAYDRGMREALFRTKSPAGSGVWYKAIK
jgi:inner membrane protein